MEKKEFINEMNPRINKQMKRYIKQCMKHQETLTGW